MVLNSVTTYDAPLPAGHYSQAIVAGDIIFVSGQIPVPPLKGDKVLGTISEQTLQVLNNVVNIVKAAGGDINTIAKTNIFIDDIGDWEEINRVYAEFFGLHQPARTIVQVSNLLHHCKLEIEAVAFKC